MNAQRVKQTVLVVATLLISAVFLWMIWGFLLTLLLAAIFTALSFPLYRRLLRLLGGRGGAAAIITVLLVVCVVLLPLLSLLGIVTAQAIKVSESVKPWVQRYVSDPEALSSLVKGIPFFEKVRPVLDLMVQKAGEIISGGSRFLINRFSSAAGYTVGVIFQSFVFFYAMFFFLKDGEAILLKILHYLPLEDRDERLLLERFTSVSRATIKGTLVIGIMQGALAGIAFAVAGIPSAVFWGTVMTVLSIIPGIGTALVWVPAAAILAVEGNYGAAAGLALFCALAVGSVDNLLRPRLVGRDTKMHELMVFLGTMGGIVLFGVTGLIVGPIVAALFVTIWDIYGEAFADVLPVADRSLEAEEGAGNGPPPA